MEKLSINFVLGVGLVAGLIILLFSLVVCGINITSFREAMLSGGITSFGVVFLWATLIVQGDKEKLKNQ